MRNAYINVVSIAMLVGLGVSQAQAQQGNDKAAAEQLFMQGRELMKQGNLDEACARLEASQKLDPAVGTLLNLALCREQQGRVASAWALYREAAVQARREGQEQRAAVASERATALEGELPRLVIEVAEASEIAGLVVERDGTVVDAALFGVAVYVDPGVHRVVAQAPGYQGFSTEIEVEKGKQASVMVPALARAAKAQAASEREVSGPDASKQETSEQLAIAPDLGVKGESEQAAKPSNGRKIVGLSLGGVGVAAMVAGLGFGWSAKTTWDDAFSSELCNRDTLNCEPAGQEQTDTARSYALTSNILVGAGVALAAAGVVLYVTAPERAEKPGLAVVPVVNPSELGMAVQGGF